MSENPETTKKTKKTTEHLFGVSFVTRIALTFALVGLFASSVYFVFRTNLDEIVKSNEKLSNAIQADIKLQSIKSSLQAQDFSRVIDLETARKLINDGSENQKELLALFETTGIEQETFSQLISNSISHQEKLRTYLKQIRELSLKFEQTNYHLKQAFNVLPEAFKPQALGILEQINDSYGTSSENISGKIQKLIPFNDSSEKYLDAIDNSQSSLQSYQKFLNALLLTSRDLEKTRSIFLKELESLDSALNTIQDMLREDMALLKEDVTEQFLVTLIVVSLLFALITLSINAKRRIALLTLQSQIKDLCKGVEVEKIAELDRTDEIGSIAKGVKMLKERIKLVESMQDELRETIQESKNTSRMQNTIVSKIGSEIRTPINSIIGYSEMVVESYNENMDLNKIRKDIENIASAGTNLLDMVDSLLELTEESEASEMKVSTFNVRDEIQRNLHLLEPIILRNNNKFTVHCPDPTISMDTDVRRVIKVITNIISHSALNTDTGQITLNIVYDRIADLVAVKFVIRDTGAGFSSEATQQLISIFGQEHINITDVSQDKIGPAIAKKYINELYGKVEVDPHYREGTKVIIKIPSQYNEALERHEQIFMQPLADAV